MEDTIEIWLFVAPVLFIIGVYLYGAHRRKKRQKLMRAAAARLGFSYIERDTRLAKTHEHLNMFSKGHSHEVINVLEGVTHGIEVMLADHHFTEGHGKSSTHYAYTFCLIKDEKLSLPNFFLRPERKIFDYLGKIFGGQDINFSEDEKFSSAFVLQARLEISVRNFFNQRIRDSFSSLAGTDLRVQGQDDVLIISRSQHCREEELRKLLRDAFNIYNACIARNTDY